jgi:hypothetical protein
MFVDMMGLHATIGGKAIYAAIPISAFWTEIERAKVSALKSALAGLWLETDDAFPVGAIGGSGSAEV